jgi:hypothetical protein
MTWPSAGEIDQGWQMKTLVLSDIHGNLAASRRSPPSRTIF